MSTHTDLRLFVAAEVPDSLKAAVSSILSRFAGSMPSARWARPDGFHLTLKFLGATPAARVAAIGEALSARAEISSPFDLVTGPPGLFGSPNRPRVLWIGLEGDLDAAERLSSGLEASMEGLGFARENRPFKPHLTLARFDTKRRAVLPPDLLASAAEEISGIPMGVGEIVLVQSLLGAGGARYVPLNRWSLAARNP